MTTHKLRNVVRRLSSVDLTDIMNGLGRHATLPASLVEADELQKALFSAVDRNNFEEVTEFIRKHVHVGKVPIDARNEVTIANFLLSIARTVYFCRTAKLH